MEKTRYYFLDILRGGLVIYMIIHHICYNSMIFGIASSSIFDSLFWRISAPAAGWLFIIISGISSGFSHNNLRRSIKLLACAALVTVATYVFDPSFYVKFGILHFLGCAALIYHFCAPVLKKINLHPAVYVVLFFLSKHVLAGTFTIRGLAWLGLRSPYFSSSDYFPILPYIFAYFFGVSLVKYIKKHCSSPVFTHMRNAPLEYVGTHSLWFYLAHQPIIVAIFYCYQLIIGG